MRPVVRLIGYSSFVALILLLIWSVFAISDGRWVLLAIVFGCMLVGFRGSGIGAVPGIIVGFYTGQPLLIAAFTVLLIANAVPWMLPMWSLQKRTDPGILTGLVDSVDAGLASDLARAAGGGPISTAVILRCAATDRPAVWSGEVDLTSEATWDGYLIRDSRGLVWTSIAAETVALTRHYRDVAQEPSPLQVLAVATMMVPESAAAALLTRQTSPVDLAATAARMHKQDVIDRTVGFSHDPAAADAARRAELSLALDGDDRIPKQQLYEASDARLWLLTISLKIAGPAAVAVVVFGLIAMIVLAPFRLVRRIWHRSPALSQPPPASPGLPAPPPNPGPPPNAGQRASAGPPMHPVPPSIPRLPATPQPPARTLAQPTTEGSALGDWWRSATRDSSGPANILIRMVRPLCTFAAIATVLLGEWPWPQRIGVAVIMLFARPLRRWWLDLLWIAVLAAGSLTAGPALWYAIGFVAARMAATMAARLRWPTEALVVPSRRGLMVAFTGNGIDRLSSAQSTWQRYAREVAEGDQDFGDSIEFLAASWAEADGLRMISAFGKALRAELFGWTPEPFARPVLMRRMRRLVWLERIMSTVPRVLLSAACGILAWLTASGSDWTLGPVHLRGVWIDAGAAALLAYAITRPRPWRKTAGVIVVVELFRLRNEFLPTLAVVFLGAALAWSLRTAFTRHTLNVPARLAWVGRWITGLRHRRRYLAAATLATRGRPGLAVELLSEILDTHPKPRLAAVALAQCALAELDRGDVQAAKERASAAGDMSERTSNRVATAIAAYALGSVQFEVGDYEDAAKLLQKALPVLRRRAEAGACLSLLTQALATRNVEDAMRVARLSPPATTAGQLPFLVESQVAVAWALIHQVGHGTYLKDAQELLEQLIRNFGHAFDGGGELNERTRRLWSRLLGQAHLLLGRVYLRKAEFDAARSEFSDAARELRDAAAADLLGMANIYEGRCHEAAGQWEEARRSVEKGLDLLEDRRGRLRSGADRAVAVNAGLDHYDTALSILTAAEHHGDHRSGLVAAGLMESLRRNALATMLRQEQSVFAERLPKAARDAIDEISRFELSMGMAALAVGGDGDLAVQRAKLAGAVTEEFAAAYLPQRVDYADLLRSVGRAHVLQFDVIEAGPERWRGYRAWTPPGGDPWVDEFTVDDADSLALLRAASGAAMDDSQFARSLQKAGKTWALLAAALLPPVLHTELRRRSEDDPARLLIVAGEQLAYLPWVSLVLDNADEESVLLHKAVVQLVPSLTLLRRPDRATRSGRLLTYLDDEARDLLAAQPSPQWQALAGAYSLVYAEDRAAFEENLARERFDGAFLTAHGDGIGLAQGIQFDHGGVLSTATALGLAWPRWMVFASCFVAKVEHKPGQEPLGLVIACLLGGCRTVIGGVIAVARPSTMAIAADTAAALAAGRDPAAALRRAQRSFFDEYGAIGFVYQWAGLICISTECGDG